jgi:menaquinone-dependent protoporphyrinogen IX oxidase
MNIGIIIASQTGHTDSVALKLKEKLSSAGHTATIEQIIPKGEVRPGMKNLNLKTKPKVDKYDALVFGASVMAFSLSPIMNAYLRQIESLKSKKVAFFITKGLPFYWTGGKQAAGELKRICEAKGASVRGSGIVIWSSANRDQKITEVVDKLSGLF